MHADEQQDRELGDLHDEPQVAPVALEQVEQPGDDDRGEREEQQEPDDQHGELSRGPHRPHGRSGGLQRPVVERDGTSSRR